MLDFLSLEPTTILSGKLKSLTASPSLKNSGFVTTENLLFLFLFFKIFSIKSPVITATGDVVTISSASTDEMTTGTLNTTANPHFGQGEMRIDDNNNIWIYVD